MNIITDKSFKYDVEKLDSTSDEVKFIKQFYDTTGDTTNVMTDHLKREGYITQVKDLKIYKVIEDNPIIAVDEKNNNLMLFHGTTPKGATGILKEGYKISERGRFGKGST